MLRKRKQLTKSQTQKDQRANAKYKTKQTKRTQP